MIFYFYYKRSLTGALNLDPSKGGKEFGALIGAKGSNLLGFLISSFVSSTTSSFF